MVEEKDIEAFQRDGAVCLRGVFRNWVEVMAAGIGRNMAEPGPYASENFTPGDTPLRSASRPPWRMLSRP